MYTENKDPIVEHETIDDLFDQETEEHVLSELKDDGDDPQLPEELSEGEAAEILRTMISQRRTYTQSMRQKKQAELLRGYGKTIRESQHGHSSVSLSTWKVSDHRRGFEEAHEVQSMP